ncbi:A-kinase anchor protein 6 [Rhinophrynus dorsalis]
MDVTLTPTRPQDMDIMESPAAHVCDIEPPVGQDCAQRYERPPPLHTGADWKIILHLPEIDTWIRSTSERVRGLTQSVQEDPQSKHVDVHLMQLKEICEDISDHVEQIHALLDTEFSLKLLSYSVNVIVDIHTVQLLWHQLRVSVLVLRERILQGLQDSNGNYTRQTDILQAFTQENQEDRLDALTEVDCSGQLTIRCPPDYLSLDCGITAYELSDYSPRGEEETHTPPAKPLQAWTFSAMQQEFPDLVKGPGLLSVATESEDQLVNADKDSDPTPTHMEESGQQPPKPLPPPESTTPKRPLQDSSDHGGDSPTRPSLPKRGLFLNEGDSWGLSDSTGTSLESRLCQPVCPSSPRNHLSLTLTPPYSPNTPSAHKTDLEAENGKEKENVVSDDMDSQMSQCPDSRESPRGNNPSHSSEHKESPKEQENHEPPESSPKELGTSSWYGSDEFLALPSHLHETDILALHLGSLSQLVSPAPEEPLPPLRDVEDWEISSGSENGPSSPRCFSPSTPSDLASYLTGSGRSTPRLQSSASSGRQSKAALIQKLMWDIQRQDNDRHVWDRIQGFVSKLDKFIRWLQDAMEATENWTPPQPETEALQLYLHTHLNFKQNVDGHCALKDAVLEEGHRLMEVLVSHRPGFVEMLQMITAQWKELQRQIRRQHGWILGALDTIKAEILQNDESLEELDEPQTSDSISSLEAQRNAVSKMSLQLSSAQYSQNPPRSEVVSIGNSFRNDSLQEVEAECQEFWDWLLDMEATVQNSLGLLVSEDQHLQMCKRCSVEMSLREDRVRALLGQLEALKREGTPLPDAILDKEGQIREKWEMLKKSLSEALSCSASQAVLSPGSGSLVQQLEQRVKELKSWLRDTELTLYNSSLRVDEEGDGGGRERLQRELHRFQSLCSELRLRRRGVTSVLRLCHHLLSLQELSQQQDPPSLQLLSVNLERRWEAIVMQSTQWQRRLQRELGEEQELDLLVDPDWADLNGAGAEEALEWDETDITVDPDPENIEPAETLASQDTRRCSGQAVSGHSSHQTPFLTPVYQVYSLHNMELFRTDMDPLLQKGPKVGPLAPLPLSLLQGCTFSSLPDLASGPHQTHHYHPPKIQGGSTGHSESESGIASGGEGITAANSEGCLSMDGEGPQGGQVKGEDIGQIVSIDNGHEQSSKTKNHGSFILYDSNVLQTGGHKPGLLERTQRAIPNFYFSRTVGQPGTNRTMLPSSSEDHSPEDTIDFQDLIEVLSPKDSPHSSSSLESLSANCEVLGPTSIRRTVSLESWPASYKSNEDLFSQQGSADITPGSEPGEELSKRTLDLLKRLEDIECPTEQKMKRSLSDDITLRSGSREASLAGLHSPTDRESSGNEDLGSEITELSSSEEISLRSEDLAGIKGRLLDSNASFRKHLSRSLGGEEAEANLSMIVNVSCTSACTDEEDDSDLLSSSTLTLTEEEEEEEEEELEELNASLGSEDEAGDGTDLPLGADFIRRELQAWTRPSFLLPRERRRKISRVVQDMTGTRRDEKVWKSSLHRQHENNGNGTGTGKDSCKNLTTVQKETLYTSSQLVDDVENGNVSSRISTIKGSASKVNPPEGGKKTGPHPWVSINKTERLHPPSMPALAYHKPREPGPSFNGKSNLRVTSDAVRDVDMPDSSQMASDNIQESSCSCHASASEKPSSPDCTVHEFVKEILDMASTALNRSPPQDGSGHGTGAQIREKVLEHSRRHLDRGDFYSYLSLSSHDSDCGELNGSVRAITPQLPAEEYDEGDMEGMFEACTEDKDEEQFGDHSSDSKVSFIGSSTQQQAVDPVKNTLYPIGTNKPQSKSQPTGQHSAPKGTARKFHGHSDVTPKGANSKSYSKILAARQELHSEPRGKITAKQTLSSLPILHKRVREQRPAADGTEHQKKPPHGPKNHREL